MLIRVFSDIHTEFHQFDIPRLDTDKDSVCVLAGDIGVVEKADSIIELLQRACEQFKHVVYVFGNHEFYKGGSIVRAHAKLQDALAHYHLNNLHVLENQSVILDGVAFVGATLWTDFDRGNPGAMLLAEQYMNDYRHIRTGITTEPYRSKLYPRDVERIHARSRKYVLDTAAEWKAQGYKVVVVVHHGVSYLSISDEFKGDNMNSSFVSEMFEEIAQIQPELVIHGHVHRVRDYMIDNTRVVVNPRGYPGEQSGFNPTLTVEV